MYVFTKFTNYFQSKDRHWWRYVIAQRKKNYLTNFLSEVEKKLAVLLGKIGLVHIGINDNNHD